MSSNNNEVGTNPTNTTLTPDELVAKVRELQQQIAMPEPTSAPVNVRRRLGSVHHDFIVASISATAVSETVQSALGRTDEDLRQENDTTVRWVGAADEIRQLYEMVIGVIRLRRQRSGLAALQTYQICRQLVRDERHAARLGPFVAEMQRLNRFGRSRRQAQPADAALKATAAVQTTKQ